MKEKDHEDGRLSIEKTNDEGRMTKDERTTNNDQLLTIQN
jgi:hypothetical protein